MGWLLPSLLEWRSIVRPGGNGDICVPEGRLRTALAMAQTDTALRGELDRLLGRAWDEELDVFRCGAEGAPVRWLHATG